MDFLFNIGMYHFLLLGLFLFLTGLLGTIISKNLLRILISLEIMFCGITLNLATFSVYSDGSHFKGEILALFVLIMATVHIAVGVAIVLNIHGFKGTVDVEEIGELKG